MREDTMSNSHLEIVDLQINLAGKRVVDGVSLSLKREKSAVCWVQLGVEKHHCSERLQASRNPIKDTS